jgi:hypothetical protein
MIEGETTTPNIQNSYLNDYEHHVKAANLHFFVE